MSSNATTTDHDPDQDSPQIVRLNMPTTSQESLYRWRRLCLVLHAYNVLVSIIDNTKNDSSYTILQTHDADAGQVPQDSPTQLDIVLDIHYDQFLFNISREILAKIVNEKNLVTLHESGGVEGIAAALDTSLEKGICGKAEDLCHRQALFGSNTYLETPGPAKGFFHFLFKDFKNVTVILLLCCSALSLGSGIKEEGLKNGWYDGTIIFIAIFILIAVTSISNYCRARKFQELLNNNTTEINVLRDGQLQPISVSDVVVGDIIQLKIGDRVPADGLFLNGYHLQVDEVLNSRIDHDQNPFLFSGAKVINGFARMLVTSVGKNTVYGELMSKVTRDLNKKTPLQARLDKLNSCVQNIGLFLAMLILVVLLLRFLVGKREDDETGYPELKGKRTAIGELMKAMERLIIKPRGKGSILTTTLALFLVGIQEGLPFIVTLSLTYWNKRLLTDQAIVQELSACVTMGSVTTIITDETGGLLLNKKEVDTFWVGEKAIIEEVISVIATNVLEALCDGVGTPFFVPEPSSSQTEDSVLPWAKLKLGMNMEVLKQSRTVLSAISLNSDKKRSGLLMRKNGDTEKIIHLHWQGDAESILAMCSYYYNINGKKSGMDEQKKMLFNGVIENMATNGLQSIAFAYKQIEDDGDGEGDVTIFQEDDLILLGLVGLKYSCQPEVRKAVEALTHAGVSIKLVSTDNLSIVRAIAIECGILRHNQDLNIAVLEGEKFRNLSKEDRMQKVDQISMLGSCLPFDKLLMVQCLREKSDVVAVTGTRTSDSPALKEADIGISVGTQSSESAKENSEIVILDGSFALVTTIFKSGGCAHGNIQKFVQFELTMIIAGLLITFITTVSLGEAPLSVLQLFWVNLIVGTPGALTLLTELPSQKLVEMPLVHKTEPLITKAMWRNIIIQVTYQATVLLTFQLKGQALPGMNQKVKKAMIFNGFVLCQVFNQLNARQLEKKNVFTEILQNHWFLLAMGLPIVFQVVVVEFAKCFAGTVRLNWEQWLACMLIASISWPIDWAAKCVLDFPTTSSV